MKKFLWFGENREIVRKLTKEKKSWNLIRKLRNRIIEVEKSESHKANKMMLNEMRKFSVFSGSSSVYGKFY